MNYDQQRSTYLGPLSWGSTEFHSNLDSIDTIEHDVFLAVLSHRLAELYSSALDLPAVEADTTDIDHTPFPADKGEELWHALKRKFEPLDSYWVIFDSTEKAPAVQGTLAGDISEIYSDLKHDIDLEQQDVSQADSLWELRFSFRSHWGKHLLDALVAIHDRHVE